MLGVTGPGDGLEGDVSAGAPDTRIRAVVNYFGPADLGARDIPEVSKPLVRDFLGATPTDKPELAAKASPRTYVTRDDAPILTFQGTKDPLVPHTQAIVLAEAMTAAGVPGRVELMVGAGHGWGGAEMDHTRAETFGFFDRLPQADRRARSGRNGTNRDAPRHAAALTSPARWKMLGSTAGMAKRRLWSICSKISGSPRKVVAGCVSPFEPAGSGYDWSAAIRSGRGGCAGRRCRGDGSGR